MLKYRFVWPFYIDDCYECGKALHFQWPLVRVHPPVPLSDAQRFMVDSSISVMAHNSIPIFSKESMVMITPQEVGATIIIPRVQNS